MVNERRISPARIVFVSDKYRNKVKFFKLLDCSRPRAARFEIGSHDQSCVCYGVNDLVALHGIADIESRRRIVRRYKQQPAVHERLAIFVGDCRTLKTVGHHRHCLATGLKHTVDGGAINAFSSAGNQRLMRLRGEFSNPLRVTDKFFIHVA